MKWLAIAIKTRVKLGLAPGGLDEERYAGLLDMMLVAALSKCCSRFGCEVMETKGNERIWGRREKRR